MKYLSVCSGIEAATVAWHPLGWEAVAYSEIEKFPSEVLAHHYPNTPNVGDMTKFKEWNLGTNVDLLVGGTPCQSFSVAGLRKGLDDPRGNLMLTYLAIAKQYRPNWLVWENVPGVLSSNGGRDFGSFLGGLAECGYGFAYRVLDAQYFGVAQRRRRVFVVGYLGDWRPAAAVLFERHSLSGHLAPSRKKGEKTSFTTGTSVNVSYDMKQHHNPQPSNTVQLTTKNCIGVRGDTPLVQPSYGIPGNWIGRKPENGGNATEPMHDIAPCLTKADQHGVAQAIPLDTMTIQGRPSDVNNKMGMGIGNAGDPSFTLTKGHSHAVAQPKAYLSTRGVVRELNDVMSTLDAARESRGTNQQRFLMQTMLVRRLTPTECERLQGFPDNYTDIKSKNKPTPDGPRYKALGNSMAVPVMRWIGERIKQYEEMA
jgi:DNA (cytosine-5)-methyltransferase 1